MENQMPKLSVAELTSLIKTTLEGSFYGLTVEGEISGFRPASTGHWYFSLKDKDAVIGCCMWRTSTARVPFKPKDGMKVIVTGNISVFEPRGTYQIICSSMQSAGEGDILAMLEERKRHYDSLGYFDPSLKKPIPKRPAKVAVITSPTGAALQDILQITGRRNGGMDIIILPAIVQGQDAAPSIAARIKEVNEFLLADVMI
ncbi:MAG: exodeoxyribonuclease VII large subunit, partial [Spirochaetales bacterium]|nr:exodeoxyribonuclease VII large subunit [Spirochaetales bacterium]